MPTYLVRSSGLLLFRVNVNLVSGAMVLGHSLKDKGAKGKLVVLATLDNLHAETISELKVRKAWSPKIFAENC